PEDDGAVGAAGGDRRAVRGAGEAGHRPLVAAEEDGRVGAGVDRRARRIPAEGQRRNRDGGGQPGLIEGEHRDVGAFLGGRGGRRWRGARRRGRLWFWLGLGTRRRGGGLLRQVAHGQLPRLDGPLGGGLVHV